MFAVAGAWDWVLLAVLVGVAGLIASWLVRNAGPLRTVVDWCVLGFAIGVVGLFASMMMDGFSNAYKAYGEVPVPGSERLHLPAGDVMVSFSADVGQDEEPPIPANLELLITPPSGIPQPTVTEHLGDVFSVSGTPGITSFARQQVKVLNIPVAGDYTITAKGNDSAAVNPRLSFGRASIFRFLRWPFFPGLIGVSLVAGLIDFLRDRRKKDPEPVVPDAGLLVSGLRARGVLKSFAKVQAPAPTRGGAPTSPESLDAPFYELEIELWIPNLLPKVGRNRQQVPLTEVPKLEIGSELNCAVDLADPTTRFVVDWDHPLHG